MNSGRWVIGGIFVVGLIAAGAAWWHRYQQVRYCLEFWGPDAAYLIRLAPEVDLMRLAPGAEIDAITASAGGAGETAMLTVDGEGYQVMGEWDMSRAQGLAHAREALVQDQSFAVSAVAAEREPVWQYALRFRKGDREATLLFDLEQSMTRRLDQTVTSRIKIAEGLRTLFRENTEPPVLDENQERPLTSETP